MNAGKHEGEVGLRDPPVRELGGLVLLRVVRGQGARDWKVLSSGEDRGEKIGW